MAGRSLAGGRLTINLDALAANYRLLAARSGQAKCAAVVKANAYGLGAKEVVERLVKEGCERFFVALPEEGIALRKAFPNMTIYLLNGIHKGSVDAVARAGLLPVLSSMEQVALWAAHGENLAYAIQVDTGMNRLGLSVDEAIELAAGDNSSNGTGICMVMSHLACADVPEHPKNAEQLESFQKVVAAFSDLESSLANSAATLTGGDYLFDMTRPGIALYGGAARNDIANPMQAVATLEARIAQIRHAKKGESVSYGATQILNRDTKIAVVSVGYADGYPRAGSGTGVPVRGSVSDGACGFIGGYKVPLLGRVTMDLCMFDVTDVPDANLHNGWIELFGENIALDDAARACGTIGYELLTSLGNRYERRYRGAK